jgi:hypothetical protein
MKHTLNRLINRRVILGAACSAPPPPGRWRCRRICPDQDRCCASPPPLCPTTGTARCGRCSRTTLDKSAPGEFDVQINLNASLFKQGTEPAAMARGNLELSSPSRPLTSPRSCPSFRSSPPATSSATRTTSRKCSTARSARDVQAGPKRWTSPSWRPSTWARRQVNLREVKNVQDAGRPQRRQAAHARQQGVAVPGRGTGRHRHAAGLWRGLPGPEDRHHRRPGQPAAHGARAKFYEVTKQIVLTSHLVDGIFIAISNKSLERLSARRSRRSKLPPRLPPFNNENRIKEEAQIVDFFKSPGVDGHHAGCGRLPQAVQALR